MGEKWLPRREGELLQFTASMARNLSEDPAAYGLTQAEVAAYAVVQARFADLYAVAASGATRSPVNITRKDAALAELVRRTRATAAAVRGGLNVSAVAKVRLGLSPAGPKVARVPPPTLAPRLRAEWLATGEFRVRLARPPAEAAAAILGATLFVWTGDGPPPGSIAAWHFACNTGRTSVDVPPPSGAAPGTGVFFTAVYFNRRFEQGPAAVPAGVRVGFVPLAAAA